jgi:hypothetical protein
MEGLSANTKSTYMYVQVKSMRGNGKNGEKQVGGIIGR